MKQFPVVFSLLFSLGTAPPLLAAEPAFQGAGRTAQATPPQGMRGTPLNLPDISVIGVIQGHVSDDQEDMTRNQLNFEEVETAFQGYIYPEMRADVFLALHRHEGSYEAEICEAKASFLRIVEGLAAQAGKIHIDFGKVNKLHTHHRPMIDRPAVLTGYFGEHGLVAQGGALSYLFPLPFYFQVESGAWRIDGAHEHEHDDAEQAFSLADELFTARGRASFAGGGRSEMELGASFAHAHGAHFAEHKDKADVIGGDFTFKWWPSAYERLVFQNEWLYLTREVPIGHLHRHGMYSYLDYRFNKYFDLGGRFDYVEGAFPTEIIERAGSLIATYHLTETSAVNAQVKHRHFTNKTATECWVRLTFGIGPHSHELE